MPLQILGVGFGRTGTDSTRTALNRLGFPCYHMKEVLDNPDNQSHLDFWVEVAESPAGSQHDWERVFERYQATVDNPAAGVWRELLLAYPDAKVILTLHPGGPGAWYDSTVETIYSPERMWQWRLLRLAIPKVRKMGRMTRSLIWGRFHEHTMDDRDAAIARYEAHTEEVRRTVPADKLLLFRASDGWQPLCRFLEVPVPPDEEFPRVNDRAEMQHNIRVLTRVAYFLVATVVLVVAGMGYGIWWLVTG